MIDCQVTPGLIGNNSKILHHRRAIQFIARISPGAGFGRAWRVANAIRYCMGQTLHAFYLLTPHERFKGTHALCALLFNRGNRINIQDEVGVCAPYFSAFLGGLSVNFRAREHALGGTAPDQPHNLAGTVTTE